LRQNVQARIDHNSEEEQPTSHSTVYRQLRRELLAVRDEELTKLYRRGHENRREHSPEAATHLDLEDGSSGRRLAVS